MPHLPDIEDIGMAIEQFETDLFLFATVASVIVSESVAILEKIDQTIDVLSLIVDTDSQMTTV